MGSTPQDIQKKVSASDSIFEKLFKGLSCVAMWLTLFKRKWSFKMWRSRHTKKFIKMYFRSLIRFFYHEWADQRIFQTVGQVHQLLTGWSEVIPEHWSSSSSVERLIRAYFKWFNNCPNCLWLYQTSLSMDDPLKNLRKDQLGSV